MENAVDALKIAFAVFIFVIALSISMNVLAQAREVAEMVIYMSDKTNFYEVLTDEQLSEYKNNNGRIVGIETIIPTLYRYYKENYTVVIRNSNGQIIQLFDLNMESIVYNKAYSYIEGDTEHKCTFRNWSVKIDGQNGSINKDLKVGTVYSRINNTTNGSDYRITSFDNDGKTLKDLYPDGAPWIGNTDEDTKTRIDAFVSGKEKTINGTKINQEGTNKNIKFYNYRNSEFLETYEEYRYSGTTENGMEIVKGNTKVIITYTLQ